MTRYQSNAPADACVESFRERTGTAPRWLVSAPGRINLIGEHVDYLGGYVLPMAIDLRTYIAAAPRAGTSAVVSSCASPDAISVDLVDPMASVDAPWGRYVCGVIAEFMESNGEAVAGFTAHVHSEVPLGSGLSSSAALEVATATLLEAICDVQLDPLEKAKLCQRAEREHVGVPCGIMDQATAVFAKRDSALLLDCSTEEIRYVPFADPDRVLLVVDTGVSHDLKESAYALRRQQSEAALAKLGRRSYRDLSLNDLLEAEAELDPTHYRRARHVVAENQRTLDAASLIEHGEWARAGRLFYESHESLSQDYEVSCKELDFAVGILRDCGQEAGVYGARMTGAGFGGCAIALIERDAGAEVTRRLGDAYRASLGTTPSCFVARPSEGAEIHS